MQLAHQAASGALQQAAHWLRHAGYHCPMPALQGPEALLRRLEFSYAMHSKVRCDVSKLPAICIALLLCEAVRLYVCLWS